MEDSRPRTPSRVMASSAMGLKLGNFRFLPTTHLKTAQNKFAHDLRAMQPFRHVYLHTQTSVDADDMNT